MCWNRSSEIVIKRPRYLQKFDPKRDAHTNWLNADNLEFGRFAYSPVELQERYRNAPSDALTKAVQLEMEFEVRDQIAAGEIIVFGVQVSPELKSEAELIPPILFQSRDVEIDWDRCQISGLRRQFNDVRICLSDGLEASSEVPTAGREKAKRGRKSHSPLFEEAFALLEKEQKNFADWSLEKQTIEIREKTAALHPGLFQGGKPGRSTVYRFLQRRRNGGAVP